MASASVVESGMRPPAQTGVAPPPFALPGRTPFPPRAGRTRGSLPPNQKRWPARMRGDKALLDRAELCAARRRAVLHDDRRVADDRADVQPVAMSDVAVDDAPHAVRARDHAAEAGIGRERRAALRDEVEAPAPTPRRSGVRRRRSSAPRRAARRARSRRRARPSRSAAPARRAARSGLLRLSIRFAAIAVLTAAASISSSEWLGTMVTRETRPGAWPLRPARCRSRATPLGEPICSTRSTGRKSTPRSRLEVQTTALSVPAFRPCSTQSRVSRDSEP